VAPPDQVVFDTSALLALLDADDEFHASASGVYNRLLEDGSEFWLSAYALVETIALAHRRLGFGPVADLMASLDVRTTVVWMDELLHRSIWTDFAARRGRRFSFVDCSTLLLARSLDVAIFTFDSDFSLEGVPVVP
jgi:predicted nucleic acid-binding protein